MTEPSRHGCPFQNKQKMCTIIDESLLFAIE